MGEIKAIAEWLRQRERETDAAWIERLQGVFEVGLNLPDDPIATRIGERLWKRFQTQRDKAAGRDK